MPAKSKSQQRFMGMVHALQKGELSPSDVSAKVKDVADRIGDEDAEDFASTKHSGKPEKVAKETLRKLRDAIRTELESCGYTMTVKGDKLKSPGGTGPEDREHKVDEDVDEGFGSEDTLDKKGIKEFEQWRKDNAEQLGYTLSGTPDVKEERDYKAEYKKFQSSTKAKKYRAELNQYNRKKGTYGNGDGKDASHKGGKIVGFEAESKNRGRAEKSRLKNEELQNSQGVQTDFKKGDIVKDINPDCPHHGSEGEVKKVGKGTITFVVNNNGKNYQTGDELEKTVDQMVKLSQKPFADDHEETEKQPMSEAIKVRVGETAKTGKWVVYNPETNVNIKEVANTRAATRLMNRLMSSGQYDNVASRWVGEMLNPPNYLDNQATTPVNSPEDENLVNRGKRTKKSGQPKFGTFRKESVNEVDFLDRKRDKAKKHFLKALQNTEKHIKRIKQFAKGNEWGMVSTFIEDGLVYDMRDLEREITTIISIPPIGKESVKEKISKDEWAQYPKYARKLKPYLQKLFKVPIRVKVIKQANHNPWIDVRVARFGKDIIPNDFRVKAAKVIGARGVRDWDNVNYGNIRVNSVALQSDDWKKLLGNKVK